MGESILGLGCDILEVSRIKTLMDKDEDRFVERVLTPAEQLVYRERSRKSTQRGVLFLATRFCAKEAFAKAMGCGIGQQVSFQDVSVLNEANGAPRLQYSPKLQAWLDDRQAEAKISISDEQNYVMSTVILYSKTTN